MKDNILFFDTETTGLIKKGLHAVYDAELYPHICQLSWTFNDMDRDFIIRPDGWTIPPEATAVHQISTERALKVGLPFKEAFKKFYADLESADMIVAHNIYFDILMLVSNVSLLLKDQYRALDFYKFINSKKRVDTMMETIDFVGACFPDGTVGKYPRLEELYDKLFNSSFPAHNSMEDVRALKKCFYELKKIGILKK